MPRGQWGLVGYGAAPAGLNCRPARHYGSGNHTAFHLGAFLKDVVSLLWEHIVEEETSESGDGDFED